MTTTVRFFNYGQVNLDGDYGVGIDFNNEELIMTKMNSPIPRVGETVHIGFNEYFVYNVSYCYELNDDEVLVDITMVEVED